LTEILICQARRAKKSPRKFFTPIISVFIPILTCLRALRDDRYAGTLTAFFVFHFSGKIGRLWKRH